MCLAVRIPIPESEQDRGMFTSTFSSGILNYFKHSSTDEAIFELSQHLRLLSTLQEFESRRNGDARVCNRDLTVLLCHLYLPACPRAPLAESMCINTFSSNSSCFKVVNQINEEGYDLKWPPVKVNCQDRNWFSPNATVNNGTSIYAPEILYLKKVFSNESPVYFKSDSFLYALYINCLFTFALFKYMVTKHVSCPSQITDNLAFHAGFYSIPAISI